MKRIYLFLTVMSSVICSQHNSLFAQDKQADFKAEKNTSLLYNMYPCGDDEFYALYGKVATKLNIMKFDKNLQPVWKEPFSTKVSKGTNADFIYSYTNPADKKMISYIYEIDFAVGAEELIQLLPDGTSKTKELEIPKKELQNVAAVFTNANGLNIITLIGEKEYHTGNMNWYTFSHNDMGMTKRNIVLPIPEAVADKEHPADWWLNQVTPNGLYFSFISHKVRLKDPGPILTCNIVKVNNEGKPGNILTIDMNCDKFNVVPAFYTRNLYSDHYGEYPGMWLCPSDFRVFVPNFKKPEVKGHTIDYRFYNASGDGLLKSMDVRVDENNNRIYTIIALNDGLEAEKGGFFPDGMFDVIRSFKATVFDMAGKKINQSVVDCDLVPEGNDRLIPSYEIGLLNIVNLSLLQNNEGVVCKARSKAKGHIFLLNKDGKIEKQNKFEMFTYIKMTAREHQDPFRALFRTKKEFENSPYIKGTALPEVQFFNKMDEKTRVDLRNLSLKNGNVFAHLDSKNDVIKLFYFSKK